MVRRGVRWSTVAWVAIVMAVAVPLSTASHWARLGWRDQHVGYPSVPTSLRQISSRFGEPCSADASAIVVSWRAADTGETYSFRVHRKLAGYPSRMVSDQGGTSTNLDTDVHGHIQNAHLASSLNHGIYGYACRAKRSDPTQWSTHAWGIAVDVSSAIEPMGQCTSAVNWTMADIWQRHGWTWGLSFCDPMHFQYARNY